MTTNRRLAAIMAADVEGRSRLMELDETETLPLDLSELVMNELFSAMYTSTGQL